MNSNNRLMRNRLRIWPAIIRHIVLTMTFIFVFVSNNLHAEDNGEIAHVKMKATTPHYYWFKKTDLPADQFSFMLNGKTPTKKQIFVKKHKDFLHVRFNLQPQDNELSISLEDERIFAIKVYSAPPYYTEDEPEDLSLDFFHTDEKEKPCSPCHRFTPTNEDYKLGKSSKQICYNCHKHLFKNLKNLHTPVTKLWLCLVCHQTEPTELDESPDAPVKFQIEDAWTVAPLCYKCHLKFSEYISSKEYVHGPLVEGGCNSCHNTHGSEHRNFLIKKSTTLCIECHELQDMLEQPVVHGIIKKEGCQACHSPHASNFPMQLKDEINKLCFSCHSNILDMKDNHPLQNHPTSAKVDPSNPGSPLTCISCHNPHGSENRNLLAEANTMMVCKQCHEKAPKVR